MAIAAEGEVMDHHRLSEGSTRSVTGKLTRVETHCAGVRSRSYWSQGNKLVHVGSGATEASIPKTSAIKSRSTSLA